MEKFRVYLAGPISDCNDEQKVKWRNEIKKKYSENFDFLDPIENLLPENASDSDIVKEDIRAIKESDGLIVNMWRESVGSAIGMVHAHIVGKPVVVSNPNHIGSKTLAFYSDALEDSPLRAAKTLRNILQVESKLKVLKHNERGLEQFSRKKLLNSLKSVCRNAKKDDILLPRITFPIIIEKLEGSDRTIGNQVSSTEIYSTVLQTFQELETNPLAGTLVSGLSQQWKASRRDKSSPDREIVSEPDVPAYSEKGNVPVSCTDSHGTIWGNTITAIDQLPQRIRPIFDRIVNVHGITRIKLAQFGHGQERNTVGAFVGESSTDYLLDGKIFDKAPKGTVQEFQVWVQFDSRKRSILQNIKNSLIEEDLWRE